MVELGPEGCAHGLFFRYCMYVRSTDLQKLMSPATTFRYLGMTKKEKIKQRRINGRSHGIVMRHMQRQKGKTETHVTSEAIWAVLFFVLLMLQSGTDPGWDVGHAMAMHSLG